jgi:heptosyltransferase-3
MHLLLSRTDAIGDVCLTLPAIGWLKSQRPDWMISILVKPYAEPVAQACHWLDAVFVLPDDLNVQQTVAWLEDLNIDHLVHVFPNRMLAKAGKQAGIQKRSGVFGRPFHWLTCNNLVWLSRANSRQHEALLNIQLLAKLLGLPAPSFADLQQHLLAWGGLPAWPAHHQAQSKQVILHLYSRGSGREWPIAHFATLAHRLVALGYQPVVTGTKADAQSFSQDAALFPNETLNVMGQDSLADLLKRISQAAGLVASGTGPLHMATLTGCPSVGLFPPRQNIDSLRWGAIGPASANLELNKRCELKCRNKSCACMAAITPVQVISQLQNQIINLNELHATKS